MSLYSPQQLLDQLHETQIEWAFVEELSPQEHKEIIKVIKQRLEAVKQRLKTEESAIKGQYDGRNKLRAALKQRDLRPYALLDDLVFHLELSLTDLEATLKFDRAIPAAPKFGTVLAGGKAFSEYIITDQLGAAKWYIPRITALIEQTTQQIEQIKKPTPRSTIALITAGLLGATFAITIIIMTSHADRLLCFVPVLTGFYGLLHLSVMLNYSAEEKKYQDKVEPLQEQKAEWERMRENLEKSLLTIEAAPQLIQKESPKLASATNEPSRYSNWQ